MRAGLAGLRSLARLKRHRGSRAVSPYINDSQDLTLHTTLVGWGRYCQAVTAFFKPNG